MAESSGSQRHLVLLRHAKSGYPSGVPDHERPLAGRGRRNAQAAGAWLASDGPRLDLALCSDAVRARQTWDVARESLANPPRTTYLSLLYGASADQVLELVRELSSAEHGVVVIGHEPTMSSLSHLLAGPGSDAAALAMARHKFRTNGIAVFGVSDGWTDLSPHRGVLETFAVPRA